MDWSRLESEVKNGAGVDATRTLIAELLLSLRLPA
jgi:hypothetical protein